MTRSQKRIIRPDIQHMLSCFPFPTVQTEGIGICIDSAPVREICFERGFYFPVFD